MTRPEARAVPALVVFALGLAAGSAGQEQLTASAAKALEPFPGAARVDSCERRLAATDCAPPAHCVCFTTAASFDAVVSHFRRLPAVVPADGDDDVTVALLRRRSEDQAERGTLVERQNSLPFSLTDARLGFETSFQVRWLTFTRGRSAASVWVISPRLSEDSLTVRDGTLFVVRTVPRMEPRLLRSLEPQAAVVPPYPGSAPAPALTRRYRMSREATSADERAAAWRTTAPIDMVAKYYLDQLRSSNTAFTGGTSMPVVGHWDAAVATRRTGLAIPQLPPGETIATADLWVQIRDVHTAVTLVSPIPTDTALEPGTMIVHVERAVQPALAPLPALGTVEGPEADLRTSLRGYIVSTEGGDVVVHDLAAGSRTVLRPRLAPCATRAVAGPDRDGWIVFVEECRSEQRHSFMATRVDGSGTREIVGRKGDGPTINAILALSPVGGTLALFEWDGRSGPLWLLDIATGRARQIGSLAATTLSWFPDGRRLLVTTLEEKPTATALKPSQPLPAAREEGAEVREMIARMFVIDTATGGRQTLDHAAGAALVAPDGRRILVGGWPRQPQPGSGQAWIFGTVDLETGEQAKGLACPGQWGGPLAFIDQTHLLYWGLPTRGQTTEAAGAAAKPAFPRGKGALKVCELDTGRFQTVVSDADSLTRYSFGVVDRKW